MLYPLTPFGHHLALDADTVSLQVAISSSKGQVSAHLQYYRDVVSFVLICQWEIYMREIQCG